MNYYIAQQCVDKGFVPNMETLYQLELVGLEGGSSALPENASQYRTLGSNDLEGRPHTIYFTSPEDKALFMIKVAEYLTYIKVYELDPRKYLMEDYLNEQS